MDLVVRAATAADHEWITELLRDSWGATVVVAHADVRDAATLPALVAERGGAPVGLLTYETSEDGLEVVTLDATTRRTGVGTGLLRAAGEAAHAHGLERIWLVTTNDNLDALRFYQRRGFRIVAVAQGAVDTARRIKPQIPTVGAYGIEIHDELVLEMALPRT